MPTSASAQIDPVRASIGAIVGLLLTGFVTRLALGPTSDLPLLIAPMGAAAVLLFAATSSPLARAWPVIGGNCLSAFVGVTCAKLVADPILGASLACGVAIGLMMLCGCLHPPGGAVALTAVLGGPSVQAAGYGLVLWPVALNTLLLLAAALVFNALATRLPAILARLAAACRA